MSEALQIQTVEVGNELTRGFETFYENFFVKFFPGVEIPSKKAEIPSKREVKHLDEEHLYPPGQKHQTEFDEMVKSSSNLRMICEEVLFNKAPFQSPRDGSETLFQPVPGEQGAPLRSHSQETIYISYKTKDGKLPENTYDLQLLIRSINVIRFKKGEDVDFEAAVENQIGALEDDLSKFSFARTGKSSENAVERKSAIEFLLKTALDTPLESIEITLNKARWDRIHKRVDSERVFGWRLSRRPRSFDVEVCTYTGGKQTFSRRVMEFGPDLESGINNYDEGIKLWELFSALSKQSTDIVEQGKKSVRRF